MAAQAVLDRSFTAPAISYLLLDAQSNVLASRWPEGIRTPLAPGSLLKPWLALAYGEQHRSDFPTFLCTGAQGRCWLPRGHGRLGLRAAIADSCNAYFLQLAQGVDEARARLVLARYGLQGPGPRASPSSLVGLDGEWKETPLDLAQAYRLLASERNWPLQSLILGGMQSSANYGTARAMGDALGKDAVLAKTGTTACTHTPRAPGDGFVLAIYPAAAPRLLLLVRVHGTTGASSAKIAAAMLQALGAGSH